MNRKETLDPVEYNLRKTTCTKIHAQINSEKQKRD